MNLKYKKPRLLLAKACRITIADSVEAVAALASFIWRGFGIIAAFWRQLAVQTSSRNDAYNILFTSHL